MILNRDEMSVSEKKDVWLKFHSKSKQMVCFVKSGKFMIQVISIS